MMGDPHARSTWRLIGTASGLVAAVILGLAIAGGPGQLIAVLIVALSVALPLTLLNAFLFAHFGTGTRSGAVLGGLIGGVIGAVESIIVWRVSPTLPVIIVAGAGAIGYLIVLARTFARPTWNRIMASVNRALDIEVGLPLPRQENPRDLYYRPYPRRLQINWLALILGPAWYLLVGLWVHATILVSLLVLSGGLLFPIVWLYCGLKANEDLLEFRIARHNVY